MLKNMTRKSLALGAGLALVASGLTAAPAQAVATGQLWSAFGQTNEMVGVANADFQLRYANPAGTEIAASSTDDTGVAVQVTRTAASIVVTPVPRAGVADPTITHINSANATATANGVDTVTINRVSESTLTGGSALIGSGIIKIGAPSALTADLSIDIYIKYNDGSQSETERVTFVPASTVYGVFAMESAQAGTSTIAGTFGLFGINTGNWAASNAAAVQDAPAENDLAIIISNAGTPITGTSGTDYDSVTDTYRTFKTGQTVGESTILSVSASFNSTEINQHFLAGSVAGIGKFTLSANAASAALDVSIGTSAGLAHNKTDTATATVAAETVVALTGTKALNFTISSYTDSGRTTASISGIPITVTLTDTGNGLGTSTITAGGKSLDVSGEAISFTLTTNSAGQIAFTVTADKAADGELFTMTAVGSTASVSLDSTTVKFKDASFTLLPAVEGNYSIAPGGSIAVGYTVVDQFGNLAGSDYQLAMTRVANSAVAANRDKAAEYASWSYVAPVSATGVASATIVDNGLAATEGSDTVTVSLQKAATGGSGFIAATNSTNDSFVLTYENDLAAMTATVLVNNDGIANAAGTALNPLKLETIALKSYDSRTGGSKPKYVTNGTGTAGNISASDVGVDPVTYGADMLRVYGQVKSASNSGVSGVSVKLSAVGASFSNALTLASSTLILNDSITVFTDATGSYQAWVRSSVAGTQTISVNAQGVLGSDSVRFQSSTGVATALTISGPTSVAPGARADIVVSVVDKFGKAVTGLAVNFSDNGPGVLNASAVNTDIFGNAQVTLTTVAAESGSTIVTAYATIGGVVTVVTHTIVVGKASATSSDVVVNVGTFSGKLVVYALNAAGSEVSYKIAGKWVTQVVTSDSLMRYDRVVGATGATIKVDIYVDGVLRVAKSVVTK